MQKLDLKTPDLANENLQKLQTLFPEAVRDGKVDCEALRSLFGEDFEAGQEKFGLFWPGKQKAIKQALKRTQSTLRPKRAESKDWDTTQNLFVEGDNLEVLRTLLDTYRGKVKMIYIDPPYNTGNDFVYNDKFKEDKDEYAERAGEAMKSNPQTSGRYHSDWLSMMYPRLKLAKEFLSEGGVIFSSIDDSEAHHLRASFDEVFGAENFVECLIWKRRATPPNDRIIGKNHEYIVAYAKDIQKVKLYLQPRDEASKQRYSNPDNDSRGPWVASDLSANGKGDRLAKSCVYPIYNPRDKKQYLPPTNKCWLFNEQKMQSFLAEGRVNFRENSGAPFLKRYLSEVRDGVTLATIITNGGTSQDSSAEIRNLFDADVFEFPKPVSLIKIIVRCGSGPDDVVADFFSGSGTTAHAVMALNAEDGGNRRCISVQLPEATPEDSEARKAGYQTIADIAKERIRRAGEKIKADFADKLEQRPTPLDVGFKVFALDSSNLKEWDRETTDLQASLLDQVNSFKEGRSDEDVLFEVLLRYGVDVAATPIEKKTIGGKTVYDVGAGHLVVCLEKDVDQKTVEAIAQAKPERVVFRDDGFRDDKVKLNAEETLKNLGNLKPENIRVL